MLKAHSLLAAVHGTPCAARILNLKALHDAFQQAAAGGLSFMVLGSLRPPSLNLSACVACWPSRLLPLGNWDPLNSKLCQPLPLPRPLCRRRRNGFCIWTSPWARVCPVPPWSWWPFARSSSGGTPTSPGPNLPSESRIRIVRDGGENRGATWLTATPRRHALAIAAHVSQRLQAVELILPVPAVRALPPPPSTASVEWRPSQPSSKKAGSQPTNTRRPVRSHLRQR